MSLLRTVGRPLLASVFITGGLDSLRHPEPRAPRARAFAESIAEPLSLPSDPVTLVRANGAIQVIGGSLLATGVAPRLASALLATSLVPSSLYGHAFWEEMDPQEKRYHRAQFFKNLALMGGLLIAVADRGRR